jgi:hypothetical protein
MTGPSRLESLDVLAQRALIAFEGQDVIGLLFQDLFGDIALTADRVDGHDGAFDIQHLEEVGNGDHLIGFLGHFDPSSTVLFTK